MKAWIQFRGRIKIGSGDSARGQINVEGRIEQHSPGCWYIRGDLPEERKTVEYAFAARGGSYGQQAAEIVNATMDTRVRFGCPADRELTQRRLMSGVASFGCELPHENYLRKFASLDEALEAFRPGLALSIEGEHGQLLPCVLTDVDYATLGSYQMLPLRNPRRRGGRKHRNGV